MEEWQQHKKEVKRIVYWFITLILVLGTIGLVLRTAKKATHIEQAVENYEQFQEIYNTCQKLNHDLCNMQAVPENDIMFAQFSKAQRLNTIKTQLNRWIEDYNAKSKMWGRALWKSSELPYQLSNNQFPCNN